MRSKCRTSQVAGAPRSCAAEWRVLPREKGVVEAHLPDESKFGRVDDLHRLPHWLGDDIDFIRSHGINLRGKACATNAEGTGGKRLRHGPHTASWLAVPQWPLTNTTCAARRKQMHMRAGECRSGRSRSCLLRRLNMLARFLRAPPDARAMAAHPWAPETEPNWAVAGDEARGCRARPHASTLSYGSLGQARLAREMQAARSCPRWGELRHAPFCDGCLCARCRAAFGSSEVGEQTGLGARAAEMWLATRVGAYGKPETECCHNLDRGQSQICRHPLAGNPEPSEFSLPPSPPAPASEVISSRDRGTTPEAASSSSA